MNTTRAIIGVLVYDVRLNSSGDRLKLPARFKRDQRSPMQLRDDLIARRAMAHQASPDQLIDRRIELLDLNSCRFDLFRREAQAQITVAQG